MQVASIDLGDAKDRGLLRQAARRRWAVPDELRDESVAALGRALQVARDATDVDQIVDVVRTIAVLEDQNQKDEHLAEKNARIDAGKPTERIGSEPVELVHTAPPDPEE
jgi:hypothetical protein